MKRLLCAFLAIALLACGPLAALATDSGETVGQDSVGEMVVRVQLRLRELGYLNFKATGVFRSMTISATKAFQASQTEYSGSWVSSDGTVGPQTQSILFAARAIRAAVPSNASIPIGPSLRGTPTVKGELTAWSDVKETLTPGSSYKVTDYNTGKTLRLIFTGGDGHAEVECASAEDTQTFLEIFGGAFNYSKRPMVITIGSKDIACSLFGYPHGDSSIQGNDMPGHTCLFFNDSTSHVGALKDVEHQKHVHTASK